MAYVTHEQRAEKPQAAGSEGFSPANASPRPAPPVIDGYVALSGAHIESQFAAWRNIKKTNLNFKREEKKERSFAGIF